MIMNGIYALIDELINPSLNKINYRWNYKYNKLCITRIGNNFLFGIPGGNKVEEVFLLIRVQILLAASEQVIRLQCTRLDENAEQL